MLHLVEASQVQITNEGQRAIAEASTIGLKPGQWPEFIGVMRGNEGNLFQKGAADVSASNEVAGVNYWSKQGLHLLVIND